MLYAVLLAAGLVGLVAMAVLGFTHSHGGHTHARLAGKAHQPQSPGALGRGSRDAQGEAAPLATSAPDVASRPAHWLLPLLSPLNWFAWLVGAGAAGMIAGLLGAGAIARAGVAVAGAVAFHRLVVRPLWNVIFRFASEPAGNLEGCLMQRVEAVTAFNARGEGLVRIVIDGRSEDVLARLTREAQSQAEWRVRRGDELVVEEIDTRTNTCLVSLVPRARA